MWNPFNKFFQKSILGVDIGTSSIKMAEISKWGQGKTLENYGELKLESFYKKSLLVPGKPAANFTAEAIKAIVKEAKIKTRTAVFAIPDFATFCASFELPSMTEKEIPEAVRYNASRYLTMPVSEVALDWRVVNGSRGEKDPIKIFLIVVPNQIIQEFKTIAEAAGLKLCALEAEALSIARSLVQNRKEAACLMDIGVQSSTVNIVDGGFLKKSYSFNFNGSRIAQAIAGMVGGERYKMAESYWDKEQILARPDIVKTLSLLLDPLLTEIRNISHQFFQSEHREVEEIYLTGGIAGLPGVKEYFARNLQKNVIAPNCFSELLYPSVLEETLGEMSPRFSVAVGVALGGFDI